MLVEELIEKLKKMPQKASVEVATTCGHENAGGEVIEITLEKSTVIIFG